MKLGLLAPIDAEAEHAEAMLRNAAELVKQEQKHCHPVVVARECHQRGGFLHLRRRAGSPRRILSRFPHAQLMDDS